MVLAGPLGPLGAATLTLWRHSLQNSHDSSTSPGSEASGDLYLRMNRLSCLGSGGTEVTHASGRGK